MKRSLMFLLTFLFPLSLLAGVTFEKTFGDTATDVAYGVLALPDDCYLLIGYTKSFGGIGMDGYLIKIDAKGAVQWQENIDLGTDEMVRRGVLLSDGSIILTGYKRLDENAEPDLLLLKIDSRGKVLWSKTYGDSAKDVGMDIKATPDGNFVVVGYTQSYGAGGEDVWLLKINADGDTLWTKTIGSEVNEVGRACSVTSDGSIYICGNYRLSFTPQMYMAQADHNGLPVWTNTYATNGWTEGYNICNMDTIIAFAGYGFWGGTWSHDMLLVEIGARSGKLLLTAHDGSAKDDYAFAIKPTTDNAFVLAGKGNAFGSDFKAFMWKVSKDGATAWKAFYGGDKNNIFWDVIETNDHGYLAVGETNSSGAGNVDVYVVKTDENGQITGLKTKPRTLPTSLVLEQNYPNPFNPGTHIRFALPEREAISVTVYDLQGRRVKQLAHGIYGAGYHQVFWNGKNESGKEVAGGLYFYELKTDNHRIMKKMLLVK